MSYFEFESTINKATLNEVLWLFIPQALKIFLAIVLFSVVVSAIWGDFSNAVAFLALIMFFVLLTLFMHKRNIKTLLQRQQENEGTSELNIAVSFLDESIKIHNIHSGGEIYISYDTYVRFEETKNFYVLITKANQFVVVKKEVLTQEGKNEDFIHFLRAKCTKVRKWRIKRK